MASGAECSTHPSAPQLVTLQVHGRCGHPWVIWRMSLSTLCCCPLCSNFQASQCQNCTLPMPGWAAMLKMHIPWHYCPHMVPVKCACWPHAQPLLHCSGAATAATICSCVCVASAKGVSGRQVFFRSGLPSASGHANHQSSLWSR